VSYAEVGSDDAFEGESASESDSDSESESSSEESSSEASEDSSAMEISDVEDEEDEEDSKKGSILAYRLIKGQPEGSDDHNDYEYLIRWKVILISVSLIASLDVSYYHVLSSSLFSLTRCLLCVQGECYANASWEPLKRVYRLPNGKAAVKRFWKKVRLIRTCEYPVQ